MCRIYGVDWRSHLGFVQEFTELGRFFDEPVQSYSHGMMARLAFAVSMVIDFDRFLIDEVVAVGDSTFTARCNHELFEKAPAQGHGHRVAPRTLHSRALHPRCRAGERAIAPLANNQQAFDFYQASLTHTDATPA